MKSSKGCGSKGMAGGGKGYDVKLPSGPQSKTSGGNAAKVKPKKK